MSKCANCWLNLLSHRCYNIPKRFFVGVRYLTPTLYQSNLRYHLTGFEMVWISRLFHLSASFPYPYFSHLDDYVCSIDILPVMFDSQRQDNHLLLTSTHSNEVPCNLLCQLKNRTRCCSRKSRESNPPPEPSSWQRQVNTIHHLLYQNLHLAYFVYLIYFLQNRSFHLRVGHLTQFYRAFVFLDMKMCLIGMCNTIIF